MTFGNIKNMEEEVENTLEKPQLALAVAVNPKRML